jgi:hypothetical protein
LVDGPLHRLRKLPLTTHSGRPLASEPPTVSDCQVCEVRRSDYPADVEWQLSAPAVTPAQTPSATVSLNRSLAERTRGTASGLEREMTTGSRVGSFVGALTASRKVATRAEAGPGAPPSTSASTNRMASSTSVGTLKILWTACQAQQAGPAPSAST